MNAKSFEDVKKVLDSKMGIASKKKVLVEVCGLTKFEADMLCKGIAPSRPAAERLVYTFGVEIEQFVNPVLVRDRLTARAVSFRYESYNHTDNKPYYKFVSDSSVRGLDNPIECVTPVLKGANGFKSLENCIAALNEAGSQVNRSCGLHVHIGAGNLTDRQYADVFENYKRLENIIDTFMAPSRRRGGDGERWCRSIAYVDFTACQSREDVKRALAYDRYHRVNPMSWDRHHTIEFRQHAGTVNFQKIKMWVSFCGKLVIWTKKNGLLDGVASIAEIPFLNAEEKRFFTERAENFA